MEPLARMKMLADTLREASRAYYQENRELMTDREYDALYDELAALEAETGVHLAGSPTTQVGYEILSELAKVQHETPMLSLDKTKDTAKLAAFLGEQAGVLSWKLDGLTIALRYEGGELRQAVTRGNGKVGEDVTHTARVFENVPLRIPFTGELVVRGEAVIRYADFEKINASLGAEDEKYKNPRNLCSGTVRQLNSEVAAKRHVRFYAFELVAAGPEEAAVYGQKSERLQWLASLGFEAVEHENVTAGTVADAVARFRAKIPENPMATDGLVLTYDSVAYSASMGATSKFPKDAIALKWADETSETTLLYIEWKTSRTGLINPIAVFEPVEIEGTTVEKASLHNVSIVKNLALGVGDRITVYKANMIIPQVAENLTQSGGMPIPATCPVCHGVTELVEQDESEALFCVNPNCRAQLVRALAHFASRDAMNIEGLSEQTLNKLIEQGIVADYTDILTLARAAETIKDMENFGGKSCDNLLASIEKAKNVPLPNFINALGIRQVGLSNATLLSGFYAHDIEKIIAAARSDGYAEELSQISGFGEVITRHLHLYFSDEKNIALLRKALALLQIKTPVAGGPLQGMTFVITGDVQRYKNRKDLQTRIEQCGGRCAGSVTAKTTYLINNDALSNSAKNKKAAALGVRILTEDALRALAGADLDA